MFMFYKLKSLLAGVMGLSVLVTLCCCDAEAKPFATHGCCKTAPAPLQQKDTCLSCPHQNLNVRFLDKVQAVSLKADSAPFPVSYLDDSGLAAFEFSTGKAASLPLRSAGGSPPVDLTILYLVLRP